VTVGCRLQQYVVDPGAGPAHRVLGNANILGDLIGSLETDAIDIFGQDVRVATNPLDGLVAVGLVDPDGRGWC
jgi:hypothetical protein